MLLASVYTPLYSLRLISTLLLLHSTSLIASSLPYHHPLPIIPRNTRLANPHWLIHLPPQYCTATPRCTPLSNLHGLVSTEPHIPISVQGRRGTPFNELDQPAHSSSQRPRPIRALLQSAHFSNQRARPRRHSSWQRRMQLSFQLGTWCGFTHTTRRQASVHESTSDTPHTVTHVFGVGSLENGPIRFKSLRDAHTRSHTNESPPTDASSATATPPRLPPFRLDEALFRESALPSPSRFRTRFRMKTTGTAAAATAHQSCTIDPDEIERFT
ncbi:unnamed protein product [Closterium sp. NIES-54]